MDKKLEDLLKAIPFEGYDEKDLPPATGRPEPAGCHTLLGLLDLTTLDVRDTEKKVAAMCRRVNRLPELFPGAGQVAGVCVYPRFVPVVKDTLQAPEVSVVAVAGGFPAAQTFRKVKTLETEKALEAGAREIDIVLAVGALLEGDLQQVFDDVKAIREVTEGRALLKVILEAGLLTPGQVHTASVVAMAAGADFIKTSTGKVSPAARPGDVMVMARAARRYHEMTGKKVGIKPAGGIATAEVAEQYAAVIRKELGEGWIDPSTFRIGASRLANDLLHCFGGEEHLPYF